VVIYNKTKCKAAEEAIKVQRPEGGAETWNISVEFDDPSEDMLLVVYLTF
jgi:hypothetical protein